MSAQELTPIPCGCGEYSIEVSDTSNIVEFDAICPECGNHFGWGEPAEEPENRNGN
jgi:hypothetical protein